MKTVLNLALIQTHLAWENPVQNRNYISSFFQKLPEETDVVLLPEMFTSGFTMSPEPVAETMIGTTVDWMLDWAKKTDAAIGGSMVIKEHNRYYNRFLFVTPQGDVTSYDKRHRFMMAGEGEKYTSGNEQVIVDYLGWKLLLQICYDLRFPVFSRNVTNYDAVLYVANWPKARIHAWDILLKARAIENMAYSIGVNRIGLDGNNLEYVGHSAVYNVLGEPVVFSDKETILNAKLSKNHIEEMRIKLPFLKDRDLFTLE